MIRKLTELDRKKVVEYLSIEESLNLTQLNHIKVYGFNEEHHTIYGEFDEENNYVAILISEKYSSMMYAQNRLFNKEWLKILENLECSILGGAKELMDHISPYFEEYRVVTSYFSETSTVLEPYQKPDYDIIKVTTEEECEKIYWLLKSIDEFAIRTRNKDRFIDIRMNKFESSMYYIEEQGKAISTVTVAGETENCAVVIMVGTAIEYRNRGLATILMKHIMNEYIEIKQKSLCLFYDNPKAGEIYKRVGFKDVDKWVGLFKD